MKTEFEAVPSGAQIDWLGERYRGRRAALTAALISQLRGTESTRYVISISTSIPPMLPIPHDGSQSAPSVIPSETGEASPYDGVHDGVIIESLPMGEKVNTAQGNSSQYDAYVDGADCYSTRNVTSFDAGYDGQNHPYGGDASAWNIDDSAIAANPFDFDMGNGLQPGHDEEENTFDMTPEQWDQMMQAWGVADMR